jgi:hypothetical protein
VRRRDFIGLLGGKAAISRPLEARTQQRERARHMLRTARTRIRRPAKKAGLPDWLALAACRHGGVTELGDAELTEQGVMALSGHLTPEATRLYLKHTEKQREGLLKSRAWLHAVTSASRRRSRQRRPQRSHPMLLNLQRHPRPALHPAAGRLAKLRWVATA